MSFAAIILHVPESLPHDRLALSVRVLLHDIEVVRDKVLDGGLISRVTRLQVRGCNLIFQLDRVLSKEVLLKLLFLLDHGRIFLARNLRIEAV